MKKKLQAVEPLQTEEMRLGAALAAFGRRYDLAVRQLSNVCGGTACGVSKSTIGRCYQGDAGIKLTPERRQCVAMHLRDFLTRRGLTADAINKELSTIFPEATIMIVPRTPLPFHVQQFFGLKRDPFDPVKSDPRDISEAFTYPALERIIIALEDAINYQGFAAVIGPVGSGKSQLKKRIVQKAYDSNGRMRLLFPDFANMKCIHESAVVSFVLESFGQRARRGRVAAYEQLRQHLSHLSDQGTRVAIAFDEAHRLNDEELSALKNFWELSSGGYQRYLGVVIFGQPRFKERLENALFREIAERVEIIEMPGLGKHSYDYLAHRIGLAGGNIEKVFERKAVDTLAAQVETPLALGNLANAAMIKAHSLNERRVLAAFVKKSDAEPFARVIKRAS